MEMEKRKMMKIQKQKEIEQQILLDELNKRQLHIIGKKSNYIHIIYNFFWHSVKCLKVEFYKIKIYKSNSY